MNTLQEQIADLLARQWGAIKSAELNDLPTIASYLAYNLTHKGEGVDCETQEFTVTFKVIITKVLEAA